jgi:hypothetical protein
MGNTASQLTTAPAAAPQNATVRITQDLPTLMARQNELLEALIGEQRELNRWQNIEKIGWITGDEAALMLGKTISPSGHHLRVLDHCRKEGLLTVIGQSRNITYWYEEVKTLQTKVANNAIVLP